MFVISPLTSSWLESNYTVDVQLQLFVYRSDFSVFSKAVFGRGVLLRLWGKVSGYFGWKGTPEVLPNFLPLVDGLLYYHHLPRHLVGSIYQTHQLLVIGLLQQWPIFRYLDSLEIEILPPGEFLFRELLATLSTIILPWVMLLHLCRLPVGHDLNLEDFFLGLSP